MCSLPAFLRSAEKEGGFTHYIYLAFHNNDRRNFKAFPSEPYDKTIAYKQGATFIAKCLKKIVNDENPDFIDLPYKKHFNIENEAKTIKCKKNGVADDAYKIIHDTNSAQAKAYIEELIVKLSNRGKKARILIHVDEHRKMCGRTGEKR